MGCNLHDDRVIVALSVDPEAEATDLATKHKLSYQVAYGLDAREEAERIGASINEDKGFLHATEFILRGGKVWQSTYSNGPLGRLQADHVVKHVGHHQKQS